MSNSHFKTIEFVTITVKCCNRQITLYFVDLVNFDGGDFEELLETFYAISNHDCSLLPLCKGGIG